MLRTVESETQLHVIINNIPSSCAGNCTFNWANESTPIITEITPENGMVSIFNIL